MVGGRIRCRVPAKSWLYSASHMINIVGEVSSLVWHHDHEALLRKLVSLELIIRRVYTSSTAEK